MYDLDYFLFLFFFSSRRRLTRCALVTGVQTCALPILEHASALIVGLEPEPGPTPGAMLDQHRIDQVLHALLPCDAADPITRNHAGPVEGLGAAAIVDLAQQFFLDDRSEERRVGKGFVSRCRSGCAPSHQKKKK